MDQRSNLTNREKYRIKLCDLKGTGWNSHNTPPRHCNKVLTLVWDGSYVIEMIASHEGKKWLTELDVELDSEYYRVVVWRELPQRPNILLMLRQRNGMET